MCAQAHNIAKPIRSSHAPSYAQQQPPRGAVCCTLCVEGVSTLDPPLTLGVQVRFPHLDACRRYFFASK